jgi:hypothetical protein
VHSSRKLLFLAALTACGPRTVSLEPKKIVSVGIVAPGGAVLCANDDATPLRAFVRYRDGTTLASRGTPGATPDAWIRPGELQWSTSAGMIDPGERLIPPTDRLTWLGQPITVRVQVTRAPAFVNAVTLAPRYDCGYVAAAGPPGPDGGTSSHGGPGASGARVAVSLTYLEPQGQRRYVFARVHVEGAPDVRYYVIDPAAPGRFTIDARGGAGGRGGAGATGSSGHSGSDGIDGSNGTGCGNGGNGGNGGDGGNGEDGGNGGNGGDGGDGGVVSVDYDARFPELVRLIRYDVAAGEPGPPGAGGNGGSGGSGGDGGDGGKGGRGTANNSCHGSDGTSGSRGRDGSSGRSGADGMIGRPGRPGEVRAQPVEVGMLFAEELARAVPIVVDAPAAP